MLFNQLWNAKRWNKNMCNIKTWHVWWIFSKERKIWAPCLKAPSCHVSSSFFPATSWFSSMYVKENYSNFEYYIHWRSHLLISIKRALECKNNEGNGGSANKKIKFYVKRPNFFSILIFDVKRVLRWRLVNSKNCFSFYIFFFFIHSLFVYKRF